MLLNDEGISDDLFPFTLTRQVADMRIGILTIRQKWEMITERLLSHSTENLFSEGGTMARNLVPSKELWEKWKSVSGPEPEDVTRFSKSVRYPWDIVQLNNWAIRQDFELITSERKSLEIPATVQARESANIFLEEGAMVSHCFLNATTGPIYIGKNATIMEGAMIRGPFALCEGAVIKMGAKIYGATTIGPYSVAGGEIKNSVLLGYSNKAHDGYLGDSVIGEWCNLGAGTTNSNLKNNAGIIKVWHEGSHTYREVGTKFGLMMGDYSRCAINTSFNTGSVVGVSANIFGEGLTPSYIPSFTWGFKPVTKYDFDKALRDISNWKKLKGKTLSNEEVNQLRNIFNQS